MSPRGRPSTGVKVQVRIPADLLAWIDKEAKAEGLSRAAMIRDALSCYPWGQM